MKKALMTWGGWDGHAPKETTELFAGALRKNGFDVTISQGPAAYTDKALMDSVNLIVQCITMSELPKESWLGLNAAVTRGVGFAGWHGGMCDSFRGHVDYQFMTGGQFLAHPGAPSDFDVHITATDDPIMDGVDDFHMPHTEQYYMMVDPRNQVLATTNVTNPATGWVKGAIMPVVWKRRWGKGRIFFNSLGHNMKDFEIPQARIITERGLLWAAM